MPRLGLDMSQMRMLRCEICNMLQSVSKRVINAFVAIYAVMGRALAVKSQCHWSHVWKLPCSDCFCSQTIRQWWLHKLRHWVHDTHAWGHMALLGNKLFIWRWDWKLCSLCKTANTWKHSLLDNHRKHTWCEPWPLWRVPAGRERTQMEDTYLASRVLRTKSVVKASVLRWFLDMVGPTLIVAQQIHTANLLKLGKSAPCLQIVAAWFNVYYLKSSYKSLERQLVLYDTSCIMLLDLCVTSRITLCICSCCSELRIAVGKG